MKNLIFSGHESVRSTAHFRHGCSSIICQPQLSYPLSFVLPNMNCVQSTNRTKEPDPVSVSLSSPLLSNPLRLIRFMRGKINVFRTRHPFQISMTHRTYVRPTRNKEPRSDSCRYAPPPPTLQNNFLLLPIRPLYLTVFACKLNQCLDRFHVLNLRDNFNFCSTWE
jgi:hypothetical protein